MRRVVLEDMYLVFTMDLLIIAHLYEAEFFWFALHDRLIC